MQLALVFAVALLAIIAARPYFERAFVVSPTPRSIEPRGSLSNIEGSTPSTPRRVATASFAETMPIPGVGNPSLLYELRDDPVDGGAHVVVSLPGRKHRKYFEIRAN